MGLGVGAWAGPQTCSLNAHSLLYARIMDHIQGLGDMVKGLPSRAAVAAASPMACPEGRAAEKWVLCAELVGVRAHGDGDWLPLRCPPCMATC